MTSRPALKQLLQGYLHLDWPEEYGDPWCAVADFLRSEPEYALLLATEISDLLMAKLGEDGLRRIVLEDLSSGYLPEADGFTYESWLKELARRTTTQEKDPAFRK